MGISSPEDAPTVHAASAAFLKLCLQHGLTRDQVVQTGISVMVGPIVDASEGDEEHAVELVSKVENTLRSAVIFLLKKEKGE